MGVGLSEDLRFWRDSKGVSAPMLAGMAAILVLVAVAAVFALSSAATANEIEVEPHEVSSEERQEADSAINASLFVHVSGAVNSPGLYELAVGSRVADAVNAAGGFAENADDGSCNLARPLEDGEHVVINEIGQAGNGVVGNAGKDAAGTSVENSRINLNTASVDELTALPGIGESTARKIVSDREANGPFKTVDDLTRVSGIGSKKLESIHDLVCV